MVMRPIISSGFAGKHVGHALFGREYDRQPVGPAVLQEQLVEALLIVGLE
jgi:hypothetical protein